MKLGEILKGRFESMPEFVRAAKSRRFTEGVNNVGIYALPNSGRTQLLEVFLQHGFGRVLSDAIMQAETEEKMLENSFVLLGPFVMETVFDIWQGLNYFVANAHGFELVGQSGKCKSSVRAYIGDNEGGKLNVSNINDDGFSVYCAGLLPDGKKFSLRIMDGLPDSVGTSLGLDGNYLYFSTSYTRGGEDVFWINDKVNNWDIQLNGPDNHKVMREVVFLGEAIKDYCFERAKRVR
jgi:hypothetical protein